MRTARGSEPTAARRGCGGCFPAPCAALSIFARAGAQGLWRLPFAGQGRAAAIENKNVPLGFIRMKKRGPSRFASRTRPAFGIRRISAFCAHAFRTYFKGRPACILAATARPSGRAFALLPRQGPRSRPDAPGAVQFAAGALPVRLFSRACAHIEPAPRRPRRRPREICGRAPAEIQECRFVKHIGQ